MPDVGRQIWEIRVPRDVELTPLENRNEQEKNKDNEKRNQEKLKNEKNERWMKGQWKMIFHEMILGQITLKHSLGLLIFFSKPRTQAYITYLKSPFWLNVDTWTEELLPWENFLYSTRLLSLFPQPTKKSWSILHLFEMNFEFSSA